ncbi:MAG: hypothetical protein K8R41_05410 [Bacteroidales bacterium]|nr:hypothetical protein [Bacteroidales bacterium]
MKILLSIFVLFLSINLCSQQTNNAEKLLEEIKGKYEIINDYQAKVHIHVDVDFLKMPDKKATVYFKKPDKFRMKSKGFAMLPKNGVNFIPTDFIKGEYTAISISKNDNTEVIKLIYLEPDSEIILSTLWIDIKGKRITAVDVNTKNAGSYRVEISYAENSFDLPSMINVSFDIREFELPVSFTGEFIKKKIKKAKDKETKGSVTINYSDYKVNEGIDDKIFKKKTKK